jgi:hypothetical protein
MAKITWENVYNTVSDGHINWQSFFDERQLKEINFNIVYADNFAHGTDGHNARLIVAKMAELLNLIQEHITFHAEDK